MLSKRKRESEQFWTVTVSAEIGISEAKSPFLWSVQETVSCEVREGLLERFRLNFKSHNEIWTLYSNSISPPTYSFVRYFFLSIQHIKRKHCRGVTPSIKCALCLCSLPPFRSLTQSFPLPTDQWSPRSLRDFSESCTDQKGQAPGTEWMLNISLLWHQFLSH